MNVIKLLFRQGKDFTMDNNKTNKMQQNTKVSRQKIEEVTSLVKKLQELTGKKVAFEAPKKQVTESKEDKVKRIKNLIKIIEVKTGKKVVFEKAAKPVVKK
jgi:hypothetical protein